MKHYSLVIEEKLVREVDRMIREFGLYSSRSDFIRDSIRARLLEIRKMISELPADAEEAEEEPHGKAEHSDAQAHSHPWKGVH